MDNSKNNEFYTEQSKEFIKFLISCKQWSGLSWAEVKKWVLNFQKIENGDYMAYKLLSHILYYSESDMETLLFDGIEEVYKKDCFLSKQLDSKFTTEKRIMNYAANKALNDSIFVPLLSAGKPGESANAMMRILTQRFKPAINAKFSYSISDINYSKLVIIDDCIGSGEQFTTFWEEAKVESGELLRDWSKKNNIEAFYVCLIGYYNVLEKLKTRFEDIKIVCPEKIYDHHRIFLKNSYCWENDSEMEAVFNALLPRLAEKSIPMLGWDELDFAVILHKTIPDWSLPLFHKQEPGWDFLMERKNSI